MVFTLVYCEGVTSNDMLVGWVPAFEFQLLIITDLKTKTVVSAMHKQISEQSQRWPYSIIDVTTSNAQSLFSDHFVNHLI